MFKKTAVNFIELKLLGLVSFDSEELRKRYKAIIEQAKEMEKNQIKNAFVEGSLSGIDDDGLLANKYYNETYK